MQLHISRGAKATGKTIRLRQTAKRAGLNESQILVGTSFLERDLEIEVLSRARSGAKVICIDECSEEQISGLRRIKARTNANVTVHAVVAN